MRAAQPAERVVKNNDVAALNVRCQGIDARHSDAVIFDERVVHRRGWDPEDLNDECAQQRGNNKSHNDDDEDLAQPHERVTPCTGLRAVTIPK